MGSKIIRPFCCLASILLLFLLGVRERLPCCLSMIKGLYFGNSAFIFFCALVAHSWGFLHFLIQSRMQGEQLHHAEGMCSLGWGGFLVLADIFIRSVVVFALWILIRHLAVWCLVGACSVLGWYHTSSWSFRCEASFMA